MKTDGGMRVDLALILAACSALQFINPVFGVTAVVVLAAMAALVVAWNSSFGRRFRLRLLAARGLPPRLCRQWRVKSLGCAGLPVSHLEICASRISLTRVSPLDASADSDDLVTGDSERQRSQSLNAAFLKACVGPVGLTTAGKSPSTCVLTAEQ